MKRIIAGCSAFILLSAFTVATGLFDLSITTPEGEDLSLSNYRGRRLVLVVLPVTQTAADTVLLQLLDTLSRSHADSVTMIGIPSYEDGFADDSTGPVMAWYRSILGEQFIISGPMNTRKSSAYQTPLFRYLTYAEENGYFDEDVYGAGEKFFTDREGNLTGISVPEAAFDAAVFEDMLNAQ